MALLPIAEIAQQQEQFASKTLTKIDSVNECGVGRPYSGMSGIGNKCIRALQYAARNAFTKVIPARVNRIFRTGHMLEDIMIKDLQTAGIKVWGEQDEVIGFAGHWKGHIDGRCLGVLEAPKTEHLLEMKTMKASKFKTLLKKRCKEATPGYFDQQQMYMHYTGLTRSLFMVINKDTSEYYFERIKYDKDHALDLVNKSQEVFLMEYLDFKIGDYDSYDCRFCSAREVCFRKAEVNKNCRTCEHVDIEHEGRWTCTKGYVDLNVHLQLTSNDGVVKRTPFETQMKVCKHWKKAELFI